MASKDFFKKYLFSYKWLLAGVAIFFAVVLILIGLCFIYQDYYQNKVYPNVVLGDLNLGGKYKNQAKALIQARVDKLREEGVTINHNGHNFKLKPIVSSGAEGSLAYELWYFDVDELADKVYSVGRQNNSLFQKIALLLKTKEVQADYKLKEDQIIEIIQDNFDGFKIDYKNADLVWQNKEFIISREQIGEVFNYQGILLELKKNLSNLNQITIQLQKNIKKPTIKKNAVVFTKDIAMQKLSLAPFELIFEVPEYYQGRKKFEKQSWFINKDDLASMLSLKIDSENKFSLNNDLDVYVGLNTQRAREFLKQISLQANTPAKDAKFEVKNGRVVEWQSSQDGFKLKIDETVEQIESALVKNEKGVDLVLVQDKSKLSNQSVNDLGIEELVAVGESDFSGSPPNRRHNIKIGAEALNGLLVKPGGEFSLLQALGEINKESGYKPELVIKDGVTVPEYGGGLCQIGTTTFRLAINAGLEITERRNHSYRVSYYEPAGTDATIYNPWPDFKFVNNTPAHLLLQTRIEGNKLIFEFWGTDDGREVKITDPVIYNIVPPGKPEYIQTDKLEPGEKKQVESAHSGADAYFKRTVSWPEEVDKEKIEETWHSHYVSWKAKWLIGASQTTSTDEVHLIDE